MKTVEEWQTYWNKKAGGDRIALVDYCVDGIPLTAQEYHRLIVTPNLEQLEVSPGNDILEIGCGTGLHLEALEGVAGDLAGTDLSSTLLAAYQGRARTFVCEAARQPFGARSFDRILMAGVALYFPSDEYFENVLAEISRLLRPSGCALISDMLLGDFVSRSAYRVYKIEAVMAMLDRFKFDWQINNQIAIKRALNKRYNIIIKNPA